MIKYLSKITILILGNLLAFLTFGIILKMFFGAGKQILLLSIIISIIPLVLILYFQTKKIMQELNNISKENKNERK